MTFTSQGFPILSMIYVLHFAIAYRLLINYYYYYYYYYYYCCFCCYCCYCYHYNCNADFYVFLVYSVAPNEVSSLDSRKTLLINLLSPSSTRSTIRHQAHITTCGDFNAVYVLCGDNNRLQWYHDGILHCN